jgi:hypothetical protein
MTPNVSRGLRTPAAIALVILFSVAFSRCGSIKPPPSPIDQAARLEPMLSAAGFRMLPADTPEKQEQLKTLLPLQVQYYVGKTGTIHYWMADPFYCKCMYIGSEQAYQKYQQFKLNEQISAQDALAAREGVEAVQDEDMNMQLEMFNPYGMGYVGPMMYW